MKTDERRQMIQSECSLLVHRVKKTPGKYGINNVLNCKLWEANHGETLRFLWLNLNQREQTLSPWFVVPHCSEAANARLYFTPLQWTPYFSHHTGGVRGKWTGNTHKFKPLSTFLCGVLMVLSWGLFLTLGILDRVTPGIRMKASDNILSLWHVGILFVC